MSLDLCNDEEEAEGAIPSARLNIERSTTGYPGRWGKGPWGGQNDGGEY